MRIAFDHQEFCLRAYGGIGRYFVRLAEQLIALQQEVAIFAALYQNRSLGELPAGVVHGYALCYPPKSGPVLQQMSRIISNRAIKRWRPQVVHETYYSRDGFAPKTCRLVVTVHDMIHELYRDLMPTHDKNISQFKRMTVDRADHVICVSENTRRDLINLFGTNDRKVSVVQHGYDRLPCNCQRDGQVVSATRPYLFYVGARDGYKNFAGFLRAVASSQSLKGDFDIVAFGGGRFTLSERRLFGELGFRQDQVRQLTGDDKLLGNFYQGAAAFVYPSLYEGFGLPPLEAMAHQCAVISSNTSSMPEVIGDAGEFFDPISNDSIAEAIARVVYSSSRTRDLVARGHKRLDLFSWNRCADQTLNVYRNIL